MERAQFLMNSILSQSPYTAIPITCDGNSYFDTEITPNNTTKLWIKAQVTKSTLSSQWLCGVRDAENSQQFAIYSDFLNLNADAQGMFFQYGDISVSASNSNVGYNDEMYLRLDREVSRLDYFEYPMGDTSLISNNSIFIGGLNDNGVFRADEGISGVIEEIRIEQNGRIIRHFVGREQNGVAGFLDLMYGGFYVSLGTPFTIDEEPINPELFYDYTTASSTQLTPAFKSALNSNTDYVVDGKTLWTVGAPIPDITSRATGISEMFRDMSTMTDLDLSAWTVTDLVTATYAFSGLNLSSFALPEQTIDIGNATNMFSNWSGSAQIPINQLTFNSAVYFDYMFDGYTGSSDIVFDNFSAPRGRDFNAMFRNFNTTAKIVFNVFDFALDRDDIDLSNMFNGYNGDPFIDIRAFDTRSVQNMDRMFRNGTMKDIWVSSTFTDNSLGSMDEMYQGCEELTIVDLHYFTKGNVIVNALDAFENVRLPSPSGEQLCSEEAFDYIDSYGNFPNYIYFRVGKRKEGEEMFYGSTDTATILGGMASSLENNTPYVIYGKEVWYPSEPLPEMTAKTSVDGMFGYVNHIHKDISLDFSRLDMTNIPSLKGMFRMIGGVVENENDSQRIDLTTLNATGKTSMENMFLNRWTLEEIILGSLNFSTLVSIVSAFEGCTRARNIDFSQITIDDNTVTTYATSAFEEAGGSYSGQAPEIPPILDISNLPPFSTTTDAFSSCYFRKVIVRDIETEKQLNQANGNDFGGTKRVFMNKDWTENTDASNYYTVGSGNRISLNSNFKSGLAYGAYISKTTYETLWIAENGLPPLPVSEASFSSMFSGMTIYNPTGYGIGGLDFSRWTGVSVTNISSMFSSAWVGDIIGFEGLDFTALTSMESAFQGFKGERLPSLSSITGANLTNMFFTFAESPNLTSVDFSNLDSPAISFLYASFWNCTKVTEILLTNLKSVNIDAIRELFSGCTSLITVDLSSLDTSLLADAQSLFLNCNALETVYVKTEADGEYFAAMPDTPAGVNFVVK